MKRIGFLSVVLAAALTVACHRSDSAKHNGNSSAVGTSGASLNTPTNGDKDFVRDMAIANMADAELGQLAGDRSTNNELKKFAGIEATDHAKVKAALASVASKFDIPIPTELNDKYRELREKLTKRNGADFDLAYIDAIIDDHEDVVDKLEKRTDRKTLAEWHAQVADRVKGEHVGEHGVTIAVLPEKSDNAATFAINEWAAATLPVVQAHLDAARVLKVALDKARTTH